MALPLLVLGDFAVDIDELVEGFFEVVVGCYFYGAFGVLLAEFIVGEEGGEGGGDFVDRAGLAEEAVLAILADFDYGAFIDGN